MSNGSGRNDKLQELARDIERLQIQTGTAMSLGELKQVNYGNRRQAKLEKRARKLEKREVYR